MHATGNSFSSTAVRSADHNPWLASVPVLFVLIWSTGFIAAKFGLPYAPPLTSLALRFIGVLVMRVPWPVGTMQHITVAGILVQARYLDGVWCAIRLGMQPVLTAFAALLVAERVRGRQWIGLALGLCGVALIVANKISLTRLTWQSIALCVMALLSITIGTLYQKHYCTRFDLRTGATRQCAASLSTVQWTWPFIEAWAWSVRALSIGTIFLLFALIRKSAATQVTSLLYLTPPTTALMAWMAFGEAFRLTDMAGMLLAVVGMAFVVRR